MMSFGQGRIQLSEINHFAVKIARLMLLWVLVAVVTLAAQAQTYNVLHNFTGGQDGATPTAGVTLDRAGNLYGTASTGGTGNGSVYELKRRGGSWILNPLYEFTGGADGQNPVSRVIFGRNGTLYGTTYGCNFYNCGTVFNLRPRPTTCTAVFCSWLESVIYSFSGYSDGDHPGYGDLIFDSANNIFGTTIDGGSYGVGVLYQVSSSGIETVLFNFGLNESYPYGGVVMDGAGNLYGTAWAGGTLAGGTAYQLVPNGSGWTENTLADFGCNSEGDYPWAGFVFDSQGNIYGANSDAGPSCPSGGGGTVFELTPSGGTWTLNTLYNNWGGAVNSNCGPRAALTMDAAGNLYGTTYCDGVNSLGNVFELSPSNGTWTYTDLYDFTGQSDGRNPVSNVSIDGSGNLYGTTSAGGSQGFGVVWEITP